MSLTQDTAECDHSCAVCAARQLHDYGETTTSAGLLPTLDALVQLARVREEPIAHTSEGESHQ